MVVKVGPDTKPNEQATSKVAPKLSVSNTKQVIWLEVSTSGCCQYQQSLLKQQQ